MMGVNVCVIFVLSLAFLGASGYGNLEQGKCPDEFLSFTGCRCLHVSTEYYQSGGTIEAFQWAQAREKCRNMASAGWTVDLAYSLDGAVMQQFSKYIFNEQHSMLGYVFFVGAEKDTPSGQWQWLDGQLVDPYSYVWHIGYPSDTQTELIKTKLVPAGAHDRFYMIPIEANGYAPSFVCEAAKKIA